MLHPLSLENNPPKQRENACPSNQHDPAYGQRRPIYPNLLKVTHRALSFLDIAQLDLEKGRSLPVWGWLY